jgi:hypothetical protein
MAINAMASAKQTRRRASDEEEMLHENVPTHLFQPLLYWLDSLLELLEDDRRAVAYTERNAGRIAARVRLDLR